MRTMLGQSYFWGNFITRYESTELIYLHICWCIGWQILFLRTSSPILQPRTLLQVWQRSHSAVVPNEIVPEWQVEHTLVRNELVLVYKLTDMRCWIDMIWVSIDQRTPTQWLYHAPLFRMSNTKRTTIVYKGQVRTSQKHAKKTPITPVTKTKGKTKARHRCQITMLGR